MKNTILLILAIFITIVGFVPLLLIQSYRRFTDLDVFHLGVAVSLDHLWCKMIFGIDGHTVSAVIYKKIKEGDLSYEKYVKTVNWLFRDKSHCKSAYNFEYRSIK